METLIIKRDDVVRVLDMPSCIDSIETAFRLYGQKKVQMPARSYLTFDSYNGDLRGMSAYIPDFPIAGIKAVNVHPDNRLQQMPTLMATIILIDPRNGFPLAIMDGTHITNMRTGAGGAVATNHLANENIETMGFVGGGTQARFLLDAILRVRPGIRKIKVYDINETQSLKFKDYCQTNYSIQCEIAAGIGGAVQDCGIVNTSTSSRRPLFNERFVSPGTHINAMGADAEGKQEISASVLKKAVLVIDDWTEASHTGEINVPVHMGEIMRNDIYAELGEIVTGQKKGRQTEDEITIFDSAGLALQDIVTAWTVYKRLIGNEEYMADIHKTNLME
jgi:alanine dehydrogenase